MPLPRRRRDDFEASRVYEYPQHLRAAIEDAPTGAGGSVTTEVDAHALSTVATGFDAEGYKILVRPILTQSVDIVSL